MISQKLQEAINVQIAAEMWSSNLYLSMSFYFKKLAKVDKIDVVPQEWESVLDAFENVYKHECHVSSLIDELVNVASSEKDKASQDFLWGYVREQVEEEATALGIVEKLKRCKDEASILYMDEKLGER